MTTDEIHDALQNCPASEQFIGHILGLLIEMNGNIGNLEAQLKKQDRELSRAANIASCLANGIKPD